MPGLVMVIAVGVMVGVPDAGIAAAGEEGGLPGFVEPAALQPAATVRVTAAARPIRTDRTLRTCELRRK